MPGARSVVGPDGRAWKVGRRWLPERVRVRREPDLHEDGDGDGWSLGDAFSLDDISPAAIVAAVALLVLVTFLATVVWPLVAFILELVVLGALFVAGAAARLLLRRPWRVEAHTPGPPPRVLAWEAAGWRRSRRVVDEVAGALRAGEEPIEPREAVVVVPPQSCESLAAHAPGRDGGDPAPADSRYERFRPRGNR